MQCTLAFKSELMAIACIGLELRFAKGRPGTVHAFFIKNHFVRNLHVEGQNI